MIVSVVIPCRNEEKHIKACIQAIYASELDAGVELEVLVVDGMSDDNTREIIHACTKDYKGLRIVENQARVTPVAFNLGIHSSTGDFIQIIGSRQLVSVNYIQGALNTLVNDPTIWCVGGRVDNTYQSKESELIGKAMSSPFGVGAGNFRIAKTSTFTETVGTPMYPKFVFDKIGYFDESLVRNQDDEFNYRVIKAGGKIFLNADISLKYFVRAQISNLKKQYYQYGYWKVFVNKKHRTVTTLRQLFPVALILGLILGSAIALFFPPFWWLILAGLFAYLFMAFFFAFRATERTSEVFSIMYCFIILHFSYGFGYLVGLIKFFVLNQNPSDKSKELSRQ